MGPKEGLMYKFYKKFNGEFKKKKFQVQYDTLDI